MNKYRTSADLSRLKTQDDVTEFAMEIASDHARKKTGNTTEVDFSDLQFIAAEPANFEFHGYRFTGGSSAVTKALVKKIKSNSGRAARTGLFGDYNHVGVGLKKSGKYTYAGVFFAKYTAKLQDSHEPKITGTVAVGKTLAVDLNGWKVAGGQVDYQWYVGGNTVGESGAPLAIGPDLLGKRIYVSVSVSRDGYYAIYRRSDLTAKVAKGTISPAPTPTVTGSRLVGEVLTATAGTWLADTELTYQWKRNGVAIGTATGESYEQVAADRGKTVTVTVTGTKTGYATRARTSASPGATLDVFGAPIPTISSPNENVGVTFTAGVGTWTPKASSYSYRWYRDGAAISKATSKTYKTVAKDRNTEITVRVTGKKTGYKTLTVTSNPHYFGVE